MNTSQDTTSKVLVTYSHKDTAFATRLKIHLQPFSESIYFWSDIPFGNPILPPSINLSQIQERIDEANVFIVLASADYLASDFLADNVLPAIIRKVKTTKARLIPIIVRPALISESPLIEYQFVNSPTNPISSLNKSQQEAIWVQVSSLLKDYITKDSEGNQENKTEEKLNILELRMTSLDAQIESLAKQQTINQQQHTRDTLKDLVVPIPDAIITSLHRFRKRYPEPNKTAFIMMRFAENEIYQQIHSIIKASLKELNINAVRADETEYNEDLYYNILTYMHGCNIGIAVYDKILKDDYNPNISLEVGYMLALGKHVCLLKDMTLVDLHIDLAGKLYKKFDPSNITETIPKELSKWLSDRELI